MPLVGVLLVVIAVFLLAIGVGALFSERGRLLDAVPSRSVGWFLGFWGMQLLRTRARRPRCPVRPNMEQD
jgi:hypothetical protein